MSRHRFYPLWRDMMNRCYSPNNRHFKDYGGRGIVVCHEWHNVAVFIAWAEQQTPQPPGYSLDRHPNMNGSYAPDNCRFALPTEQNRNMRSNVWVTHNNERLIFKDFVEKYGVVSYDVAKKRVSLRNFSLKDAALIPPFERPRKKKTHCKHGHPFTPDNIYWHNKQRHCRVCRSQTQKRWSNQ